LKLISALYPLPQELSNAYPPDEAAGLLGQAFERRESIDGLSQLRRGELINFDGEVLERVESGEWLLVKDNAYAFDWGQFDKPVRKRMFDQRVQELLRAPPVQASVKIRYGQSFRVLNSETRMTLPLRPYVAVVDGEEVKGKSDFDGVVHVFALSERSRISIRVEYEAPVGNIDRFVSEEERERLITLAGARNLDLKLPPIEIPVDDRAMTREAILRTLKRSEFLSTERSAWGALKNTPAMAMDWDYSMVALHHAGRTFGCGDFGALQMGRILSSHLVKFGEVGYHFGIDCTGHIFEGRDLRLKGSSVLHYNSNVIGIVLLEDLTTPNEVGDLVDEAKDFMAVWGYKTQSEAPSRQVEALNALLDVIQSFFTIEVLGGHREFPKQIDEGKVCPGNGGLELARKIRTERALRAPD